jgi:hypothetical protein
VRIGLPLSAASVVFVLLACGDPLRPDELDCEEAVSVLASCCPRFDAHELRCIYSAPLGCEGVTVYPDITIAESACIRGKSCSALVSTGVCTRAQQADQVGAAQVCP